MNFLCWTFDGSQNFVWPFLLIKVLAKFRGLLQKHVHTFWVWINETWWNVIFFLLFIYFWPCWAFSLCGLSSSCGEWGLLSSWSAQASHCGSFYCCKARAVGCLDFRSWGSWAPEHAFSSCGAPLTHSVACGIISDQGLNPCLLYWQANSSPLSHWGSLNILKNDKQAYRSCRKRIETKY